MSAALVTVWVVWLPDWAAWCSWVLFLLFGVEVCFGFGYDCGCFDLWFVVGGFSGVLVWILWFSVVLDLMVAKVLRAFMGLVFEGVFGF